MKILMFHRIVEDLRLPEIRPYLASGMAVDVAKFTAVVRHCMEKGGKFFRLDERPDGVDDSKHFVITFDDCFSDVFQNAVPFLRSEGLLATFFPVLYPILSGDALPLDYYYNFGVRTGCADFWFVGEEKQRFKNMDTQHQWRFVRERFFSMNEGLPDLRGLYMTVQNLKLLVLEGHEIGGHTTNHPRLTVVSPNKAYEEISGCRNVIERLIGRPVSSFAYPDGMYNPDTVNKVKSAGFTCAVSVDKAPFPDCGRFSLRRIWVRNETELEQIA